jgi:hypothetical protein
LLVRREALDGVGKPQRAEKIRWKKRFLMNSKKLGRLERQLEPNGLGAMLEQYTASNIPIGLLKMSLGVCFTTALSSLMVGFKAIDGGGIYLTVVGPRQPRNQQKTSERK